MKFRKLQTTFALALAMGVAIGAVALYLATFTTFLLQAILALISMALIFFFLHPLAHFCTGLIYGVKTKYFFLSNSDFRKLNGVIGKLGNFIPTIGVKFDSSHLASVPRSKRAFLFGAGAIISNVGMLVALSVEINLNFGRVSIILGTLFILASLGTELLFSTKVGDLSKMKRELTLA